MSLQYLGKMNPQNWMFSVMLFTKNDTALACYIFNIHQVIVYNISIVFLRHSIDGCHAESLDNVQDSFEGQVR